MLFKANTDPLPALLVLLSGVTGLVDAVSVLGLGKVFTANMTGNIVFLGFALVRTPGFAAVPLALALAGFLLGAFVAGAIGRRAATRPLRHWLLGAAVIEAALLGVAAGCAVGPGHSAGDGLYPIIVLTAAAMGLRNATVRQLKVPDLTTTVVTLTLTGLAADLRPGSQMHPLTGRRVAAVLAILIGAGLGAALVNRCGLAVPLVLAGLTTFAATALCSLHASTALPPR